MLMLISRVHSVGIEWAQECENHVAARLAAPGPIGRGMLKPTRGGERLGRSKPPRGEGPKGICPTPWKL